MSERSKPTVPLLCKLCGLPTIKESYVGPMRHSGVGKERTNFYKILQCSACSVEYISPFPDEKGSDVYAAGEYWQRKGISSTKDLKKIHRKALAESFLWLEKIKVYNLIDKVVLDFGCGSGAFLDLVKGLAKSTIGIEKDKELAEFARLRGHQVFESIQEAISSGVKVDAVVSTDAFEHLIDPHSVLVSLRKLFASNAKVFIGVPNQSDKLKDLVSAYLPHFYHVEHLWYFNSKSFEHLFVQAGFQVSCIEYLHKYNFMNIVAWANTSKAPGNPQSSFVDDDLDLRIKSWLEDRGCSSHLLLKAIYSY